MDWKDRITADPETPFAKPRIKGTRIGVEFVLERIADGWSTDDLLSSYPHITLEDIKAVRSFAVYENAPAPHGV